MNIRELSIYRDRIDGQGEARKDGAFWSLGKKGQIIKGMISGISERITINFSGTEITVPGNAVKNAKEGEIRKFQIMEISKDNLVLKEVGEERGAEVRAQAKTTVASNPYVFREKTGDGARLSDSQMKANENLAILNGEDCEAMEEDGDSLTKHTKEYVERAVERNKAQRAWNEEKQKEGLELRAMMRESREEREALGFADLKSEGELRRAFEKAGIPATPENLSGVSAALQMSQPALEMTDQTKAYMIRQKLSPTIEHFYQGRYASSSSKEPVSWEQEFEDYREQIGEILRGMGMDDETGWENAAWLFRHELPIDGDSIRQMSDLDRIAGEMTPERVLDQILFAMAEGAKPKDAVLDDQAFVLAGQAVAQIKQITDASIAKTAAFLMDSKKNGVGEAVISLELFRRAGREEGVEETAEKAEEKQIPLILYQGASEEEQLQITLKRQLEEIRQGMTMRAAVTMERKGIHIDTEPLEQVIKELRQMEREFAAKQLEGMERPVAEEEFSLLQEALEKTSDISKGFAGVLGTGVRQQTLLTVNELHAAVSSRNLSRQEWTDIYETVQTQVRKDLGDSIQKAFAGVPELLSDLGLEDTEANQRAVRILGYNRMEVTEQHIDEVKIFDEKVNRMISQMKPVTVLELIRRGENPLNTPIDALNEKLRQINEEKGVTEEEKYGRFLWQLEKSGQISEEERSGFVGIYRLLRQVEKSDGAAIGALLDSNREVTLGNLLTQVRIKRASGMDAVVDDASGTREAVRTRANITEQIQAGFFGRQPQSGAGEQTDSGFLKEKEGYYHQVISDALDAISPSKLQEMTDGDMLALLHTSAEQFAEQLRKLEGNPDIKREYYEQMAEQIRETMQDTGAAEEYLAKLGVPATMENLMAANEMLYGKTRVYQEIYDRRKILSKEREKEFDDVIDSLEDAAGEEEELERSCEQAEKIMEEVLTKSYESSDINFEDLQRIRQIGRGLRLQVSLRSAKSYDIPIRTGDTVTSLNLTIIRGADETGKVQISMEGERFGSFSLDFKVAGDSSVKGLILCSDRQGFEACREEDGNWKERIEQAGFSVKNISYGMDFKSRNEFLSGSVETSQTDTARLYQLSKILVRQVTDILQKH